MAENVRQTNPPDPTINVREMFDVAIKNQDDAREAVVARIDQIMKLEIDRVNGKFKDSDEKYQIQFNAAKEALGIALVAQEKAVASALDSTKEAIVKNDATTDKRFDLLSEKIDSIATFMNNTQGRSGGANALWGYILGGLGALATILSIFAYISK